MSDHACNTQRELAYRAVIPFYILWDLDLSRNDLIFYGQIEQLESNPNPNVQATFSYQWIANQLGINRRNAINIANKLKAKGYIQRVKISAKEYIWNTTKKAVLVSPDDTSLVSHKDTPLVSPSDTQNTQKLKSQKKTTTAKAESPPKKTEASPTDPSSSNFFTEKQKQTLLSLKAESDLRLEDLFLSHCQHHIQEQKNNLTIFQHMAGLKTILTGLKQTNGVFIAKGFVDPTTEKLKQTEIDERIRRQEEFSVAKFKKIKEEFENKNQSKPIQTKGRIRVDMKKIGGNHHAHA